MGVNEADTPTRQRQKELIKIPRENSVRSLAAGLIPSQVWPVIF
jgi:hypothetical protein